MIKDKRRFGDQQNFFLKGAFKVVLGAITGMGILLMVVVLMGNPQSSYAERFPEGTCQLLDDCQQHVISD